jgi:hypothetical protein
MAPSEQVVIPSNGGQDDFFRTTIFALARSLAKIPRWVTFEQSKLVLFQRVEPSILPFSVPWSTVADPLFSQCPRPPSQNGQCSPNQPQEPPRGQRGWVLSPQQQDAVLALGLFFLESGFQCGEQIIPYLVSLAEALDEAHVQEKRGAAESKSILNDQHVHVVDVDHSSLTEG